MLYQKLLLGKEPYFLAVGSAEAFEVHPHPEFELSFCIRGEFTVVVEHTHYRLCAGDLAVIPPMAAHSFPDEYTSDCEKLTAELGPRLLEDQFQSFCAVCTEPTVLHAEEALSALLLETAEHHRNRSEISPLIIKGNLYKISALLLECLRPTEGSIRQTALRDVEKIEHALNLIYHRYDHPLSVEDVSEHCGYSKSNFCKIFKEVTGSTFHGMLNRHRVEIACLHLRESRVSVEQIAQNVGFADAKSFCRVFKQTMGQSPGQYRKNTALQ